MRLNKEQTQITIEASNFCLEENPGIYLIRGPPGTGKSTVIVNIILEILFKSQKNGQHSLILLTAPSNAAIDGLIMKLGDTRTKLLGEWTYWYSFFNMKMFREFTKLWKVDDGSLTVKTILISESQRRYLKLIRIGPEASINKSVDKFKLSYFAQKEVLSQDRLQYLPEFKNWIEAGKDLNEFLKYQLKHEYSFKMKNAEEKILLGCNVICTTLNSCVGYRLLNPIRK